MVKRQGLIKRSVEIGGSTLELEVGRFAAQANGAVLGRYGDSMILATVVAGQERPDLGYFPLQVEYQEKFYAGGRIKGSRWVKREGRPSDEAILNARLVDRSIRPLFSSDYLAEVQLILTVLSVDAENDPDVLAINTASAALALSDIPWNGPIAASRVGHIKKGENQNHPETDSKKEQAAKIGNFMINPTYIGREYSELDLVVSSTQENIIMVEAGANEVAEATLLEAFRVATSENQKIISIINELSSEVGKTKCNIIKRAEESGLMKKVDKYTKESIAKLLDPKIKQKKEINFDQIAQVIVADEPELSKTDVKNAVFSSVKKAIRKKILNTGIRNDGRKSDEIRQIDIEVGLLPRTHGSVMFKRGETQVLTITTLAAPSLEQWIESMEGEGTKRYMHHYYMPPFSVGETGRLGWPSRREIGHGALAERALEPVIPIEEDFPYTIRVVSEIFSSNGSTSMASVCGSTLSLMDSGVPLKKPVAGIAMGLISETDKKSNKYVILSDIQGIEDHVGDMDFKVAGTHEGITALQMDVKIEGISTNILKEALDQARLGRLYILEKMNAVLPVPRAQISRFAPRVEIIKISQDQIGDVIGHGGRVIRQIMSETGTNVDIDDSGAVTVSGTDADSLHKAVDWIKNITRKVIVGEEFEGTVKRIEPFGAFVEILPGKEGLLHVSKMSSQYVADPRQIVAIGKKITVQVIEIDDLGRINLAVPGLKKNQDSSVNRHTYQSQDKRARPFRPHRH